MIHDLGRAIDTKLRARNCPIRVVDGPEPTASTGFQRERIVIEREGDDSFGSVRGAHVNPKHHLTRSIGAKITIYARSPHAGSLDLEHKRRAEHILDLVLVALDEAAREGRNNWQPKSGRFFVPQDLEGSERFNGSAYELQFSIDRSVKAQTWAGDARPETAVGGEDGVGINNTVRASVDGENFEIVIP